MASSHGANEYTFGWFICVVSGEYEAVSISATILRSWDEHGGFIIVRAGLVIRQLECHKFAFCGTVQHRPDPSGVMNVLGSVSNC
jgi:hypothetical protein